MHNLNGLSFPHLSAVNNYVDLFRNVVGGITNLSL